MSGAQIPKWTLAQMNLLDLGNTIQIAGVVYADAEVLYICMMPEEAFDDKVPRVLELSQEDWQRFIYQTDKVETEVLAEASDGKIAKVVIRKCTRVIAQNTSWEVFRRDQYQCRYCGRNDVPLTVDHLVLWEEGGPSTPDNLVSACKRCNKKRGNMQYEDWLRSPAYRDLSKNLRADFETLNREVVARLDSIPVRYHQRGR
jgi:hypothetical protein